MSASFLTRYTKLEFAVYSDRTESGSIILHYLAPLKVSLEDWVDEREHGQLTIPARRGKGEKNPVVVSQHIKMPKLGM